MRALTGLLILTLLSATPVWAKPKISEKTTYYPVTALTISGIRKDMARHGRDGFWGYTDWYVRWSGSCKLSVTIEYILPKHKTPERLPADVRKKWDAMIKALIAHERLHGQHGIDAAVAIEKDRCRNGDAILRSFAKKDRTLDARTDHGATQGVVFTK